MSGDNFSLPSDMVPGDKETLSILVCSLLLLLGVTTNTISLYQLVSERVRTNIRSKMNLLLIHLAVADLLVLNKNSIQSISLNSAPGDIVPAPHGDSVVLHAAVGGIWPGLQGGRLPEDGRVPPLRLHHDGHLH